MKSCIVVSVALVFVSVACSGDPNVGSGSTTKLSEKYRKMGDNLGATMALLKSSATSPGPVTPAELGSVARVPKSLTGGLDIAIEQIGKSGDKAANIDAIGGDEMVTSFVPDPPTGSGTSATTPSFVAWKGDAESNDEGLCHLAWTKGSSWFVTSRCGQSSGAWVCHVSSDEAVCNACNTAGECTPCDMEQRTLTCAWP